MLDKFRRRRAQRPKRWWRRSENWSAIGNSLAGVGAIAAAGLVMAGALIAYDQWRDAQLAGLQSRWSAPDMAARRNRVVDAIVCNAAPEEFDKQGDIVPKGIQADVPGEREPQKNIYGFLRFTDKKDLHYREIVSPNENYIGLNQDLPIFLDFFRSVRICIDTKTCQQEKTCAQFASEAMKYSSLFKPFIRTQRVMIGDEHYGDDFDLLLKACEYEPPPIVAAGKHCSKMRTEWGKEYCRQRQLLEVEWMDDGPIRQQQLQACQRMRPPLDPKPTPEVSIQ